MDIDIFYARVPIDIHNYFINKSQESNHMKMNFVDSIKKTYLTDIETKITHL